ncbi:MAG TPA: flagellar motor switch protein FliN, partial [Candidatus Lustribacter sp.]
MSADAKKKSARDLHLDVLMNVPLQVTVELGSVKMPVAQVLELGAGSLIALDRLAGGPVDVLVNDEPIARGEIVAVEDRFGVRIVELLDSTR